MYRIPFKKKKSVQRNNIEILTVVLSGWWDIRCFFGFLYAYFISFCNVHLPLFKLKQKGSVRPSRIAQTGEICP